MAEYKSDRLWIAGIQSGVVTIMSWEMRGPYGIPTGGKTWTGPTRAGPAPAFFESRPVRIRPRRDEPAPGPSPGKQLPDYSTAGGARSRPRQSCSLGASSSSRGVRAGFRDLPIFLTANFGAEGRRPSHIENGVTAYFGVRVSFGDRRVV